jgi:protein TonB
MRRAIFGLYGLSFLLHGAMAAGVASLPKEQKHEATAISMAEQKKPKKTEPPKPVDPPKQAENKAERTSQPRAKAAAEAKADSAPKPASNNTSSNSAAMDALPDFGLSLGGGAGGGGLAIPTGGGGPAAGEATPSSSAKKAAPPPPKNDDECADPPTKPKLKSKVQPAYPDRAREAKVEGSVRIEVQVDASGRVTSARVVNGLGHGLDEAALSAARQWTFEPATRCGKPIAASAAGPVSFRLPP